MATTQIRRLTEEDTHRVALAVVELQRDARHRLWRRVLTVVYALGALAGLIGLIVGFRPT